MVQRLKELASSGTNYELIIQLRTYAVVLFWLPDKRHEARGRRRREGATFPTGCSTACIVTIRALFQYTSLWAACIHNACSLSLSSVHTLTLLENTHGRKRERDVFVN
jgi:hypothetical protein